MANRLYSKAKERFLSGSISILNDNIRAVLVDLGQYTPNTDTDQFLSDIPSGARISTCDSFTTKSVTGGVVDADDVIFPLVSGVSVEAIVIYKHTAESTTSPLIAIIDTATGLPITPNGGNVNITWDNGSNKIFRL